MASPGLDVSQFRTLVVRPTLKQIGLYSKAAEELLIGTGLQESRLKYIKQLGRGPALGVFQMEPATYRDIWKNWLRYQPVLMNDLVNMVKSDDQPLKDRPKEMISNLAFAAAMCRIHYRRVRAPLPKAGDLLGQARYWKKYYNTHLGAGKVSEYTRAYRRWG
ncbi:MAG: hypothetical protein ACR2RE_13020 [Geminicoccaceae bacterium]